MSILIAGGKGFIGSNLAKLLDSGDVYYEVADLKDGVDVCNINGSEYKVIVLLAANLNHNKKMYNHNFKIYQWAIKQNAHIIYTSSAAVYGGGKKPHLEDEPTPAPTIYGRSKLQGEFMLKAAHKDYTILRLANVYGSGDGNGVIDIFKRGGNKIYGDGKDVRDYVGVDSVCRAIVKVAADPSAYNKKTFNISSCLPTTTNDAFSLFGTGEPKHVERRRFDVRYSLLDNKKAIKAGLL